jgi:transcriptional regulator with XRE-family HTH domain
MKKKPLSPMAVQMQMQVYANNLRAARLRRGLSVAQLAEKAGISVRTLHRIEAGEPGVAFAAVVTILWALNLLPDIADPKVDDEALRIELSRTRKTSRRHHELLRDL